MDETGVELFTDAVSALRELVSLEDNPGDVKSRTRKSDALQFAREVLAAADAAGISGAQDALASAWDDGRDYAKAIATARAADARDQVPGEVMFTDTQPIVDAINACPSRLTARQYREHLSWASYASIVDELTVYPEIVTDEGTLDADDDPNPYRTN